MQMVSLPKLIIKLLNQTINIAFLNFAQQLAARTTFYEIETSSPGAALAPGESLTHEQCTFHLEGDAENLEGIASKVFGEALDLGVFSIGK